MQQSSAREWPRSSATPNAAAAPFHFRCFRSACPRSNAGVPGASPLSFRGGVPFASGVRAAGFLLLRLDRELRLEGPGDVRTGSCGGVLGVRCCAAAAACRRRMGDLMGTVQY